MYAKEMRYYANAIELTREMIEIQPQYSEDVELTKRIEHLKSVLVEMNNRCLNKGKSILGNKSYLLPYMVEEDLSIKKGQPDYVRNGKVLNYHYDTYDKVRKQEWRFIQACKYGKWYPKPFKGNLNLNCRFLHHQNPYLKVGPFKEDHISKRPYAVIFRDILSENDMNDLIEKSSPFLSR